MIILGDSGINYWLNKSDVKAKRNLSELPISFFIIHGNHEERASKIESYREKSWRGGTVYYEEKFPDILFAKDGEIYNLNEKSVIVIGGAYSVDKNYRILTGLPWYESEQPSVEIKTYVEEQLKRCNWKVDFVLSHTCPLSFQPEDLFLEFIDQSRVDKSMEEWLEQIYKKVKFHKWYFGHFHGNRQYDNILMFYEEIRELGSDNFLQKIGGPVYKKDEWVMFYPEDNQNYVDGKIAAVDV